MSKTYSSFSRSFAMTRTFAVVFVCIFAYVQASSVTRIVGGDIAEEGRFPYQVSFRIKDSHSCGGAIISPTLILTAAHCVWGQDVNKLTIRAGSLNRFKGGVLRKVVKYKFHENYGDFLNDIAIMKLEKPLVYSKNIQPIKLPSNPYDKATPVILSGWGRVKEAGDIPRYLKHITLNTLSKEECMNAFNMTTVLCIAHETLNVGSCNGDSGGPAVWNNELIGVCSFKAGTCGGEYPDGYTDVYQFLDWIEKNSDL